MFNRISKSLRSKAFIVLVLFGIIPLLITGITTRIITTKILEKNLSNIAYQAIDKLALYISNKYQTLLDLTYYFSSNDSINRFIEPDDFESSQGNAINEQIRSVINTNQLIRQFDYPLDYMIITRDGRIFSSYSYINNRDYDTIMNKIAQEKWYHTLKDSDSFLTWMGVRKHYMLSYGGNQIYVASNIILNYENSGIIIFGVNSTFISRLLDNAKFSEKSSLFLVDGNVNCLISSELDDGVFNKLPESFLDSIKNGNPLPTLITISGEKYMVIAQDLNFKRFNDKWKIIMLSPYTDINNDVIYINYATVLLMALSLIATFLLILLINKEILKPIIKLNMLMTEVKKGNLDVRAPKTREDEIGQLGLGFNDMVVNINKYIENLKAKEKEKRELEIRMLQSQINPHFIKNTLNTISLMAKMRQAFGISEAINSFTKLLEYTFKGHDMLTTVREEISYLEEYIYLQKLRHQHGFTSSIQIDEEIMDYKILKMSFQPIVENSIQHGMDLKKGQMHLEITGARVNSFLIFTITDNGVGIDASELEKIIQKKDSRSAKNYEKIGIANVERRIKINFGEPYGLTISSEKGKGTTVKLIFPAITDVR